MDIYHGGYTKIENPKIIKDRYSKDFGVGFYCTQFQHQAERWAGKYDTPQVNVYEYTLQEDLKVLEFKEMTDEWLDFIVDCRANKPHDYDIVIGAMADDQIYNFISDYIRGAITRDQFWSMAKFKYPTHQIAFCTEESLKCITFKNVYKP